MAKISELLYGAATSLLFAMTSLYAIGFIANLVVPKSIDSGPAGPWPSAVLVNVVLMVLFAVQHSVMARRGFKRWWTRVIPNAIERFTYVLFTCLVLALLFWLWQPIPTPVWRIEQPAVRLVLHGLFWTGWLVVSIAAMRTNQREMLGFQQALDAVEGQPTQPLTLTISGLYRFVRHPIYAGTLIAFWATPDMTAGHLLFSALATAYVLFGAVLEERDLVRTFGDRYREYQRNVRMLLPLPK